MIEANYHCARCGYVGPEFRHVCYAHITEKTVWTTKDGQTHETLEAAIAHQRPRDGLCPDRGDAADHGSAALAGEQVSGICTACGGAGGKTVLPAKPQPTDKGTWVDCKVCNGTGNAPK